MNPQQVAQIIEGGLAGAKALVTSEDNVHFEAVVIAPAFAGKRPCSATNWSMPRSGQAMGNEIHALALQVFTPDEFARQGWIRG